MGSEGKDEDMSFLLLKNFGGGGEEGERYACIQWQKKYANYEEIRPRPCNKFFCVKF